MDAIDSTDKATVLVVDDTPDNLSLMSTMLKGDYKVKVANNGETALRIAAEHLPDLILLDVMMPGMDGLEVCKQLKSNPRTERIPVIFVTAQNEEGAEELGLSLGAVDYITKPITIPITMARIRNHIRLKQQSDQLAAMVIASARLYTEAQRATRAREDVLAVVAHDLRNPLSTILMSALFLQEPHAPDGLVAVPKKFGERIHRAASRMEELIKDLLDLAAIEAGRLAVERQPHKALTLVTDAIEMMLPIASTKGVRLSVRLESEDLLLSCDRGRVLQVFSNLIGNAIKFTPAGERITVLGAIEDNVFRFSVEDTGFGIAADQLPHIFDRYWQARTTDRRGVGLGLSIAAGIVAVHGGRIWVESEVGTGSSFHFTLLPAD
jgi:two-component system sensor histidine kinase/response regulator